MTYIIKFEYNSAYINPCVATTKREGKCLCATGESWDEAKRVLTAMLDEADAVRDIPSSVEYSTDKPIDFTAKPVDAIKAANTECTCRHNEARADAVEGR